MFLDIMFRLVEAEDQDHRACMVSGYPDISVSLDHPEPLQDASIRVTHILSETKESTIYAGQLVGEKGNEDMVLKIHAKTEQAEAEAQHYKEMKGLQGSVIPRFYGLFQGKTLFGDHVAGIILERFGEPVDKSLDDLDRKTKARILDCMDKIHKAGLAPDDIGPENVLSDGKDIRINDFTNTYPHECRSTYDYLNAPEIVKQEELRPALMCWELYALASEIGFWTIPKVVINGFAYPTEGMPTDPEVIQKLNPEHFFAVYNGNQLVTLLETYYRIVYKELESGRSVEELREDMEQLMKRAEDQWTVRRRASESEFREIHDSRLLVEDMREYSPLPLRFQS
ncbi:hypothetical protein VNI00_011515 [Paramarasmius palmivorus]|uniref:Protein kinase domain-containing protein n=1 Tax=Paramarasmius palmivorus TaxID=297713 RepID=A0AAW0CA82_9AGAR